MARPIDLVIALTAWKSGHVCRQNEPWVLSKDHISVPCQRYKTTNVTKKLSPQISRPWSWSDSNTYRFPVPW